VRNFIKVLCVEQCIDLVGEILDEYETISLASKGIIKAKVSFVTRLEDEELEQLKDMICKKYNKAGVEFELNEDASLIGGFRLTIGNTEYDRSIRGTLKELEKTLARR
jgi:F-type H+-transporting ATPase subunit delta